ncbi:CAP domain-containing protein [Pseudonocardia spinosispora]|uniref:CAP domain-containing protein n=1 Tax=Pseudonocardia spinosispora TaxID=103441 RepID=UPI00041A90CB|nr:CAP domain-containing protein [Pseudonocardia spinosispora]
MTKPGPRLVPLLAGTGCGALVAVLIATIGASGAAPDPSVAQDQSQSVALASPAPAAGPLPGTAFQPAPQTQPAPQVQPAPALPLIPAPPPPPRPKPPDSPQASGQVGAVLALTNAQRARAGCKPLRMDSRLNKAAQRHSADMASAGYFSHDAPGGGNYETREIAAGYSADKTGGENIARGQKDAKTVMRDWMGSPPHRKNILNCRFTTIGVGYVADGHYWTQNFGY